MPIRHLHDGPGYSSTTVLHLAKVLQHNPDAVQKKDQFGMLPVHYATLYGASVDVIQLLVKKYDTCLSVPSNDGSLPLHFAAKGNHHHLIPYFLATFGKAADHLNDEEESPIDLAMQVESDTIANKQESEDSVPTEQKRKSGKKNDRAAQLLREPEKTIQAYKEGKYWMYETKGINSLHDNSFGSEEKWRNTSVDLIKYLMQEHPGHVKAEDPENGYLPIHYACFYRTDLRVVKLLAEEYMDGLGHQSHNGWVPLHLSAMMDQSYILDYLLGVYPSALKVKDVHGKTPLEYAITYDRKGSITRLLVTPGLNRCNRFDHRVFTAEDYRLLTMIYSLYSINNQFWANTSNDHLQKLLDRDSEHVYTPDEQHNRLPIHIALDQGARDELIKMLLDNYPEGLLHQDRYGATPLHYCATWNRYHLIPMFLSYHPQTAYMKDARGEIALDHANQYNRCESVALLTDPELTIKRYLDSLETVGN
jgi:ankyrin repeat protein|eukprot:g4699.t1